MTITNMDGDAGWSLPEALEELPREMAAALVGQLVEPFRTDAGARLGRVRRAIEEADAAALRAEVHSLKGSAAQVGADVMASVCREMESAIGRVSASQLVESVSRLELHCAAAVGAMGAYSAGAGSSSC